jgi:NAD(P)-dependent dehydrogenase (short-subunit alcohol dehydrogenase family)
MAIYLRPIRWTKQRARILARSHDGASMPTILQDIRADIVRLVVRRKDLRGTERAASPSFPDEVDGSSSGMATRTADLAGGSFREDVEGERVSHARRVGSFTNRSVLITGAGSGIGTALAKELRSRGAAVITTDVEGEVDHRLDVRSLPAFEALVAEIGVPDFLFINAGIALGGPTHEVTRAHWDLAIDVNFNGAVNGLLAAYPGMVERGSGHVVFTASASGLAAPPFVAAYAASKHAVVGLALGLRPEAALRGVKVSVLCPGAVETPILDRIPPADLPAGATAPVTARQYLSLLKQKPMAADRFARLALDRVEKNRAIIVVPASARRLWLLQRLSPALVGRISASIARRVDRELLRPAP